jgi:enterochelin esterase-like enzyme
MRSNITPPRLNLRADTTRRGAAGASLGAQVSLAMAITIDANRQITRITRLAAQSFGIGRS